jgi:hypothetical protein
MLTGPLENVFEADTQAEASTTQNLAARGWDGPSVNDDVGFSAANFVSKGKSEKVPLLKSGFLLIANMATGK